MRERKNEATWLDAEERWCIQVQVNGNRKRFYSKKVGRKGKIECEKKADEWIKSGSIDGNIKVSDAFDMYIEDMKRNDLYFSQYEGFGRSRIKPKIGKKKLENLTEQDLQDILTDGYRDGLSKKTLMNIRGCLVSFLKFCRMSHMTTLHPEYLRVNKKAPSVKKRTMQPDELRILFSCEETEWYGKPVKDWYIYLYRFLVASGLRPGEVVALRREDIKPDGTITVTQSYNSELNFTEGKNENAKRSYIINREAMDAWNRQQEMLREEGIVSQWAFPRREDGDITSQRKLRKAWEKYCEHNGIEHTALYELRHTYISVNKDMPDELLKSQVGHSVAMPTKTVYSHQLQGERELAARYSTEAFDRILKK